MCNALKHNGERCRAWAGLGTDHPGVGHCKHHMGTTPPHTTKLIRQEALALMVKEGVPVDGLMPEESVLALLRQTAGHCAWLKERITETTDPHDAQMYTLAYGQERDRWLKVSAVALQYGLTAFENKMESEQVAGILYLIDITMRELGYPNEARQLFGAQMKKLAAELREDPAELEAATAHLDQLRDAGVADAEVVGE